MLVVIGKLIRKMSFKQLAENYLEYHCSIHCKDSTQDLYKGYLKVNIDKIKDKKIKDITQRDITELILKWRSEEKTNKSINNMLVFLQAVFNYAVNENPPLLSENPCQKIKKLPKEAKEMHFLNEIEVHLFLEKARELTPDYYPLFYTAVMTGMRRGELLALEWQDIDFINKKISINKQLYRKRIQSTKTTKSTRVLSIPDSLVYVLKEYKASKKVLNKIVFSNPQGDYIHPYNMTERYFKPVLKEVSKDLAEQGINNNLLKIRFHDLRHTYASLLLCKNIPIKYVQQQLGHSSSRVTLDTYGHILPSTDERAVNILDEIKKEQNENIKRRN